MKEEKDGPPEGWSYFKPSKADSDQLNRMLSAINSSNDEEDPDSPN